MHKTGINVYYPEPLHRPVQLSLFFLFLLYFIFDLHPNFYNKYGFFTRYTISFVIFCAYFLSLFMMFALLSHFVRRKHCIILSDQGIEYFWLFGYFLNIKTAWFELSRNVQVGKKENDIKLNNVINSKDINISLSSLSEEDRKEIITKVKELIDQYGYKPDIDQTLNCFKCGKPINPEDDSCSSCGWEWRK